MNTADTLPFRHYLRVRYSECDAQKVVFNARYGEYVGIAVNEFMRVVGMRSKYTLDTLDYQLVKQTIEWRASARFDDVLETRVTTHRIGTTSFALGVEFRRAGEEILLASAETIYVHVDAQTLLKHPLSAQLREALEHGAPGIVSDHAGYQAVSSENR